MPMTPVSRNDISELIDRDEAYDTDPCGDPPLLVARYRASLRAVLAARPAEPTGPTGPTGPDGSAQATGAARTARSAEPDNHTGSAAPANRAGTAEPTWPGAGSRAWTRQERDAYLAGGRATLQAVVGAVADALAGPDAHRNC
ncbi:hypothetical protein UG55_10249 [Frankia sp. EI5c]|uniref:hypothetical protein n=1 Tax=Frankia sp. EI5c TaxID=683316 RepID=UPI0007C33F46|nr:hypothetical protein [Frankia sp. EI5c]OAA25189.1 hypothetical protein UG55_10249 [Frankia sp. EI5c]